MDFLAYFKQKCRQKYQKWDCVLRHFTIYCKGKCTFGDLTVDFCKGFRNYLLTAQRQRNNGKGPISHNSAAGYWSTFRALLKITYQEKYIRENLNDFLEMQDTRTQTSRIVQLHDRAANQRHPATLMGAYPDGSGRRLSNSSMYRENGRRN